MTYYLRAGIVVVVSILMAVAGLWKLCATGRLARGLTWFALMLAYPLLWLALRCIPNEHLRLWVGLPVVILAPFWLIMGIFIYADADPDGPFTDAPAPRKHQAKDVRIQRRGQLYLVAGILAGAYGATHPGLGKTLDMLVTVVYLYGLVLGSFYAWTGRRL